jgi:tetratricopeptide (TPR) repeat protein
MEINNEKANIKNQINIDKNSGHISIYDAQGVAFNIDTHDAAEIVQKLEELQDGQLDALQQIAAEQTADLSKLFTTLLKGFMAEKNIVKGSISNIGGDVHIGDKQTEQYNVSGDNIIYNYFYKNITVAPLFPKQYLKDFGRDKGKKVPIELLERQYLLTQFQGLIDKGNSYIVLNGEDGIGKTTFASIYYNTFSKEKYEQNGWFNFQNTLYETYVSALTDTRFYVNNKANAYLWEAKTQVKKLRDYRNTQNQPTKKIIVIDNVPNEASITAYYDNLLHIDNTVFIFITKSAFSDERFTNYTLPRLTDAEVNRILSKFFTKKEQTAYSEIINGNAFLLQLILKQAPRHAERKVENYSNNILENLNANIPQQDEQITETLYRLDNFTTFQAWLLIQLAALPNNLYDGEMLAAYWFLDFSTEDETAKIEIAELLALKSYFNFSKHKTRTETAEDLKAELDNLAQKGWLIEKEGEYELSNLIRKVIVFQQNNQFDYTLEIADCLKINFFTFQHGNLKDHIQYDQHLQHYLTYIKPIPNLSYLATLYKLVTWYEDSGKYYDELKHRQLHFELLQQCYDENSDTVIEQETDLAWNYRMAGDLDKAQKHGKNALDKAYQNLSRKAPLTGKCEGNLGLILRDLGDYAGAKELSEKAMLSNEANFGKKHPTTAARYSNLAMVLKDLGDYDRAKALSEKAMLSAEENFGKRHPETAVRYSNLATVLQALGDYGGAKALLEKAMLSNEENLGEKHPMTAVSYSNLATVLQALGDYAGAKALLEKAMLSDEANFGKKHPTTAISYSNLAIVLQDLGDYEGAKVLLEKAMSSNEANFGEKHPMTAISYSNLAMVLKDLGDYDRAKALLEKAMLSNEANFGKKHPSTAISYSNLAMVLKDLGDYDRAKALLEKAMLSNEADFGENHPSTARRYSNLALILKDLGDYDRAKALLEKAMLSNEADFGENHPSTARCYSNLALILKDLGDYEGAKELSEKAMLSNETNFGEKHPTTAQSYSNLAMVLKYLGDYDRAKALLEKAILSMEKNFGKKHPNTVQSYSNLAMVFQALQEYERAIILSCKAYQVYSAHLGTEHPTTKTIEGALNSIKSEMLEKGWTEEGVRAFLR